LENLKARFVEGDKDGVLDFITSCIFGEEDSLFVPLVWGLYVLQKTL